MGASPFVTHVGVLLGCSYLLLLGLAEDKRVQSLESSTQSNEDVSTLKILKRLRIAFDNNDRGQTYLKLYPAET